MPPCHPCQPSRPCQPCHPCQPMPRRASHAARASHATRAAHAGRPASRTGRTGRAGRASRAAAATQVSGIALVRVSPQTLSLMAIDSVTAPAAVQVNVVFAAAGVPSVPMPAGGRAGPGVGDGVGRILVGRGNADVDRAADRRLQRVRRQTGDERAVVEAAVDRHLARADRRAHGTAASTFAIAVWPVDDVEVRLPVAVGQAVGRVGVHRDEIAVAGREARHEGRRGRRGRADTSIDAVDRRDAVAGDRIGDGVDDDARRERQRQRDGPDVVVRVLLRTVDERGPRGDHRGRQ